MLKKIIDSVLLLTMIFCVTACNNKVEDENNKIDITAFNEKEGGYNLSLTNAAKKYGSVTINIEGNDAEHGDYSIILYLNDKNNAYYDYGENDIVLFYNGKMYNKRLNDNGEVEYWMKKYYKYDEEYTADMFVNWEYDLANEDLYDVSITKNADGTYTWEGSYPTSINYTQSVIKLNDEYEIISIDNTSYNKDGTIYSYKTCQYDFGTAKEEPIDDFLKAYDETKGEIRTLKFYEVDNGTVSDDVYEIIVPRGFGCSISFPDKYYDENNNLFIYKDAALTIVANDTDLTADGEYYIKVN